MQSRAGPAGKRKEEARFLQQMAHTKQSTRTVSTQREVSGCDNPWKPCPQTLVWPNKLKTWHPVDVGVCSEGPPSPSELHVSEICRGPAPASTVTQVGSSPGNNSREQWKFSKDCAMFFFPEAVSTRKLINTYVRMHKYLMNAGLKRWRWEFLCHCLALVFRI